MDYSSFLLSGPETIPYLGHTRFRVLIGRPSPGPQFSQVQSRVSTGISVLTPRFQRLSKPEALPSQGLWPGFGLGGSSGAGRAQYTSRGQAAPKMPFFQSIPQTLLPPPGLVTKVCCALRTAYPAGDATVAILAQHDAKQPPRQM